MYRSSINLSLRSREKAARLLNSRLADAIDLAMQIKHAHWNVRGPNFIALHDMFDRLHVEFLGHADTLAERATSLGATADGRLVSVTKRTTLPAYPNNAEGDADHLAAIAAGLAQFGGLVRVAIGETARLEDIDTSDVFTEISRAADKALWLIEAHLQPSANHFNSYSKGADS